MKKYKSNNTKSNKNIVILGHIGCRNKGDEAVLISLLKLLNINTAPANICILTEDLYYDKQVVGKAYGSLSLKFKPMLKYKDAFLKSVINSAFTFFRKPSKYEIYSDGEKSIETYKRVIEKADYVIFSGKDLIDDCYGQNSFEKWVAQLEYALSCNGNVCLVGCSIGDLKPVNRARFASVLQKTKMIVCRETKSLEYVKNISDKANCVLVPDPAFILETTKPINFSMPNKNIKRVGISVSGGIAKYSNSERPVYLNNMVNNIEHIIKENNFQCLLVPHVNIPYSSNNDYAISKEIYGALEKKGIKVFIAPPDLSASEYKHLIGTCDFFVGARTHTTIASLSQGIPTIAIAYSRKAYGIFNDFYGSEEYVVNLSDIGSNGIFNILQILVKKEKSETSKLQMKSKEVQKKVISEYGDIFSHIKPKELLCQK